MVTTRSQQNKLYFNLCILPFLFLYLSSFDIPDIDELNVLPGQKIKEKVSLQKILHTDPAFDEFMSKSLFF